MPEADVDMMEGVRMCECEHPQLVEDDISNQLVCLSCGGVA